MKKLVVLRNFLYRFFVIGFVFSVIMQAVLMVSHDYIFAIAKEFANIPQCGLALLLTGFLGYVRLFLFFMVLSPALALHWTISRDKAFKE